MTTGHSRGRVMGISNTYQRKVTTMALNIKPTTRDVPSRKGRPTSDEILAIRAFILASLESGKTQVWEGGAAENVVEANKGKLRGQAGHLNDERAERGEPKFKMSVGAEGNDLYFRATMKTEAEAEAEAEATPETPPKGRKAKAGAGAK